MIIDFICNPIFAVLDFLTSPLAELHQNFLVIKDNMNYSILGDIFSLIFAVLPPWQNFLPLITLCLLAWNIRMLVAVYNLIPFC